MNDLTIKKDNYKIPKEQICNRSKRYHIITKAINKEFWDSKSDSEHSLYVGSYGRRTAIKTSDVDILVELPEDYFNRVNRLKNNQQSILLQTVKKAILNVYPTSKVRADGQVVIISFSDGDKFEILPAFKNYDGKYKYPDTNRGGSWKITDPKSEQEAMKEKNAETDGLLMDTCRYIRFIRDEKFGNDYLSGIVIDSFIYAAIQDWSWGPALGIQMPPSKSFPETLLEYYYRSGLSRGISVFVPGSNDLISTKKSYECLGKILKFMTENQNE